MSVMAPRATRSNHICKFWSGGTVQRQGSSWVKIIRALHFMSSSALGNPITELPSSTFSGVISSCSCSWRQSLGRICADQAVILDIYIYILCVYPIFTCSSGRKIPWEGCQVFSRRCQWKLPMEVRYELAYASKQERVIKGFRSQLLAYCCLVLTYKAFVMINLVELGLPQMRLLPMWNKLMIPKENKHSGCLETRLAAINLLLSDLSSYSQELPEHEAYPFKQC